jgi:molybdopterin molybdotransferase
MVSVKEASEIILGHLIDPKVITVNLSAATGKILAAQVRADRDLPPFDRVAMDGIAIHHDEWTNGRRTFQVAGTQAAGEPVKTLFDYTQCLEVMTGAMLPKGCDAVIKYEDCKMDNGQATVLLEEVTALENVHRQGIDAVRGQVLLERGTRITPSEVAVLASVGNEIVDVFTYPSIAIISTGDELVDVGAVPEPQQIRKSNSWALKSSLNVMGADGDFFHLRDEQRSMEAKLAEIADKYDVLILSGGVSKGKFDFVPDTLEKIGIRKLFHRVSQRPGKPFWFGASEKGNVAFALPGNPVSTFMCFYQYIKPWMQKCMGVVQSPQFATLDGTVNFPAAMTYFLQVSVGNRNGTLFASPEPGGGSGDFVNLSKVTGFLELPAEKSEFRKGEVYRYISFRE